MPMREALEQLPESMRDLQTKIRHVCAAWAECDAFAREQRLAAFAAWVLMVLSETPAVKQDPSYARALDLARDLLTRKALGASLPGALRDAATGLASRLGLQLDQACGSRVKPEDRSAALALICMGGAFGLALSEVPQFIEMAAESASLVTKPEMLPTRFFANYGRLVFGLHDMNEAYDDA